VRTFVDRSSGVQTQIGDQLIVHPPLTSPWNDALQFVQTTIIIIMCHSLPNNQPFATLGVKINGALTATGCACVTTKNL
jgi:hypothetical protein